MSGENLSKALGDISDELLNSAMGIREKKRRRTSLIASVAAAAILLLPLLGVVCKQNEVQPILTAPGVITVLAYCVDEAGNPTQQADVLIEGEVFQAKKQRHGADGQTFPLSFQVDASQYSGMELRMHVYATAGIFSKPSSEQQSGKELPEIQKLLMNHYGQEYEIEVGENVYWQTDGFDYLYMEEQLQQGNFDYSDAYRNRDFETGPSHIYVILRADEHLVGFCRIRITLADETAHKSNRQFCFQVVTSVSFPQVDGQWQEVTEEELWELLRKDQERMQNELG